MAIQAAFFTSKGEAKGKVELPEAIFGVEGSRRVLQEAIVALQANQRRGTSATKTRGLVSGGGHKPWKQKGTGNARSGSIRSPLWRKGGIIFGPLPRSYRIDLPEAKRLLAVQTALSEKAKGLEVSVLEALTLADAKTRSVAALLGKTGLAGKILVVVDKKESGAIRAMRNMRHVRLADVSELNAFTILSSKQVLITRPALDLLSNRFNRN